jgi:DNA-binding GntR family transcriptional regulator
VRDALTRLQSEGLVRIVSRVGVYVREISLEEVLEVYSIKASLEPLMAQWATERSSRKERDAFADTADDLPALAASGDRKAYIELVVARRSRFIEMARSEVISSIFRLIDERVVPLRARNLSRAERRAGSSEEHLAVADAVRRGDAKRAAELTRVHVEASRNALVDLTKVAHDGSTDAGDA